MGHQAEYGDEVSRRTRLRLRTPKSSEKRYVQAKLDEPLPKRREPGQVPEGWP